MGWLFLVLVGAEFWLLVKIGTIVGAFNTIIMLIIAGILGMSVLRRQGFSTLMRFRQRLDSGDSPAAEMFDGLLLALTGGLLMIPGFISDVMALLLLLPPLRRYLVKRWLKRTMLQQSRRTAGTTGAAPSNVIEGEYRREE